MATLHPPEQRATQREAHVYLATGEDKQATLQKAIDDSGFLNHIRRSWKSSKKAGEEFAIAIKPNIMTASIREENSPVYTNPDLVEQLIDILRDEGFRDIAIVESHNVYDYAYQGRSVAAVADMVGYTRLGYRIEDLSEQKILHDYGGVLGEHPVGRAWRDADYRISFAKNKTHWQCFYTACLKNVYGCLPEWDKMRHYHGKGREFSQCCIQIVDNFPVDFGFLDAWTSGDGFSGHVRDARPNQTRTIFAGENIFALDWVAGEKMGLDPMTNYVIQEAVAKWGEPKIIRHGDMTPWPNWKNVNGLAIKMLDKVEEAYWLSRFFSRAFASRMDKRFPPTSRFQWLFGIFQFVARRIERLFLS